MVEEVRKGRFSSKARAVDDMGEEKALLEGVVGHGSILNKLHYTSHLQRPAISQNQTPCPSPANLKHILYGCKKSLAQCRYTWRHNQVLRCLAARLESKREFAREAAKPEALQLGAVRDWPIWTRGSSSHLKSPLPTSDKSSCYA